MADVEINGLPAGTTGLATKVFETQVDSPGGTSEKFTGQQIVDLTGVVNYLPLAGGTMTGSITWEVGFAGLSWDFGGGGTEGGSFFYNNVGNLLGFAIFGQQSQLAFNTVTGVTDLSGDN